MIQTEFKKIDLSSLVSLKEFSFMDEMVKRQIDCEEQCVKNVLTQFLGKEPTIEDAKKCLRIMKQGIYDRYILACDGVQLGMIKKSFDGFKYTVEFLPDEKTFHVKRSLTI